MGLLFYNARVSTLDKDNTFYQAIGMIKGSIDFLGSSEAALEIRHRYDKVIDLEGRLVLPGFNDSHLHVLGYGLAKNALLLEGCRSIEEIVALAKKYIVKEGISSEDCLLGRGWNQDLYENQQMLTRQDLDRVSTEVPIILRRVCGHIAIVNSVVIERLDMQVMMDNPNIDIEKGFFEEDALDVVNQFVGTPSIEAVKDAIVVAGEEMLSCGFTSAQTDDFSALAEGEFPLILKAYEELIQEKTLPIRVYQQSLLPTKMLLQAYIDKGYKTGWGNEWFKLGPLKLLLDGSLGNRTAKLVEPYKDKPGTRGVVVYDQEALNELVQIAVDNKMQVAIHAIGDQAIIMCLNAFEEAGTEDENPLRQGIVHCQLTSESIIKALSERNIIAYIQPIFLDADMDIVEKCIGPERAKETYAFKTMVQKGIMLCGGSDAPVVHFNIFDNLYSAITRRNLKGRPIDGWLPKERLSVKEALAMFTKNGAFASFEEDKKGTLELGKFGDLVVIDKDIYTIPHEEIRNLKVCYTVIDGRIVYKNPLYN